MNATNETQYQEELEELRARLSEAEDTLNAIRTGEVDALVVKGPEGHAIYTLTGAERTYRLLVEAMNEGALVLSPEGNIIYSNHTFAAMLGLPLEQVIGSSVFEYIAQPDVDTVKDLLNEAVWSPGRKEVSLRREDKTSVPAHISVGGLDIENESQSISAVVTDLTEHKALECELTRYREHLEDLVDERTRQLSETVGLLKHEIDVRKQTENALKQTQNDLNRAQAVAHTGSWRMNVQNDELVWSDETYRMFGVAYGTPLTYELFLSCVHPDDRDYVDSRWQAALQGEPYDVEHRIVVGDTTKWVRQTAELEYDERGMLLGGFGTVQDITASKQSEEALRNSEAQFRAMADSIPQLAWMANPDGYIFWYNQRWYAYTGTTPEQMEGWGWQIVHDPAILPTVMDEWERSIATGQQFDMDFPLRGSDGEFRWFLTRIIPLKDSKGNVLRWFGTNTDITERIEIEQEKQRIFEREHHIAETLQQALVPSQIPYNVDDWQIAARYIPALKEAQVGGDFYDVFPLDDRKIGVLIGDVVGKGLVAAIRVAAARYAVRSYAYINMTPAKTMSLTNKALCKEGISEGNVLTAFFGILDLKTNTLTYTNAGHEPPLVLTNKGHVEELMVTGPMLGIVDCEYAEDTIKLEQGDSVVMYTDGITEARTKECVLFEQEGAITTLTKVADAPPDQIAETLLQAAILHAGGALQDDVAIVVLGYEGGA